MDDIRTIFKSLDAAANYAASRLDLLLTRVGVNIVNGDSPDSVSAEMQEHKVKVYRFPVHTIPASVIPKNQQIDGYYVARQNRLFGYVSDPIESKVVPGYYEISTGMLKDE